MAMRNLIEGECGGSNALVRTADHFSSSLTRNHRELLHHHHPNVSSVVPGLHGEAVFKMDALLNTIQPTMKTPAMIRPPLLHQQTPDVTSFDSLRHKEWANEFANQVIAQSSSTSVHQQNHHQQSMRPGFYQPPSMMMRSPMMFQSHPSLHFSQQNHQSNSHQQQFEQHLLPQPFLQEQEERLKREQQQMAMNKNQISQARVEAKEFVELMEEVESRQQKEESASKPETVEEKDDLAFWNNLAQEWEGMSKESDAYSFLGDYDSVASEPFSDGYYFKDENPFKEMPNAFEEGVKKLEAGDIPSAVLLFEAAVQQEPTRSEAWQFLGTTQAKNEQDPAAIRALKRALELDPNNLTSLMALAVSYTNESYQRQACDCLAQWILNNPTYSSIAREIGVNSFAASSTKEGHPLMISSVVSTKIFDEIKNAFIRSARMSPAADLDPDVQSGLGVLFNLSGEYDKAVDCFQAALAVKPNDALLWNRLGATLANGNRSEEAIAAYSRALQISPGFIRSRFNLGISCINLNSYQEAAEHFLGVLNLQNAGRGLTEGSVGSRTVMSSNVWSSMRMVLSLMNRQDLYDAVEKRDLQTLNRAFKMTEFLPGSASGSKDNKM